MKYSKEHLPIALSGRRSGLKLLRVGFIVAHDVGNPNSTARNNRDFYTRTAWDSQQSAHVFVDDVEAIELVPLNEKAWHVQYQSPIDNKLYGDDANDIALSIEMSYFTDKARTLKSYENYVNIIVGWLKTYNLTTKQVVGHFQLDPGRRSDPVNAFKTFGKTWDEFIEDLDKKLKPQPVKPQVIKPPSSAVKVGSLITKQDVPAYARPEWGTQTGQVVRKGQNRHVYALKNGWYQLFSGEWLPSQSGANFEYMPVKKSEPPERTEPPDERPKLKRVIVDGKQVGAFSQADGVLRGVSEALDGKAKTITIKDV